MLVIKDKNPVDSVYYISCCIVEKMKNVKEKNIDELYLEILQNYNPKLRYIDYVLALDFLFLLGKVKLTVGGVEYVS